MSRRFARVVKSLFSIEEPWRRPPQAPLLRFRRVTDGARPRLDTTLSLSYDDDYLTLLFTAADDHVVASHTVHDAPLYEEDVVEVFLAPHTLTEYFEIEVSPIGTLFDARIVSPHGERATMDVDLAWDSAAMTAIRTFRNEEERATVDTLLRVPFAALRRSAPAAGERWRGNFFRIDRHPVHGDEYSAWSPSRRTPPDFHVPAAFGELEFLG